MIAPLAGVVVAPRPLLRQPVGLADGGIQVDGEWCVAGSRAGGPGPGQQLPAHPIQLADVAPPEAAQEGPQGGWRLDHATDDASRPAGAQHVGVVDAVAASQRGCHQGHHLVARVRPTRRVAQVEALLDQLRQAEVAGQGGGKDQPGIRHQVVVVEGDVDAVGGTAW